MLVMVKIEKMELILGKNMKFSFFGTLSSLILCQLVWDCLNFLKFWRSQLIVTWTFSRNHYESRWRLHGYHVSAQDE